MTIVQQMELKKFYKNINSKVDKIIYNKKIGKGFCIKKGIEISTGQIVLTKMTLNTIQVIIIKF